MSTSHSHLWKQVLGLAVLLVAVSLCWMAYEYYQPMILAKLGFGAWGTALAIFQGLLGGVVEPWMGALSDRFAARIGQRLPQITVGITLAGLIFVLTAVLLQIQLPDMLRGLVPVLMTLWVMAMLIFRGPAIALLRQLAPTRELPWVNGILTVVFGLVGALGPLFVELIQHLGMSLTFLLGALLLAGGGLTLGASQPRWGRGAIAPTPPDNARAMLPPPPWTACSTLFCTGMGVGLGVNLLLRFGPNLLQPLLGWKSPQIAALLLAIAACSTLPMNYLSRDCHLPWGTRVPLGLGRSLWLSTSWTGLNLLWLTQELSGIPLLLAIASTGIALGWLFVTQVPWALQAVPANHAGFGVGLYFGGMGTATALVAWLALQQGGPLSFGGTGGGVLAGCLLLSWGLTSVGTIGNWGVRRGRCGSRAGSETLVGPAQDS